jgi:hypothetical protein
MKKLTEVLTWHEITTTPDAIIPDAELEVLVFDGFLNDTVKASLDFDENNMPVWIEQVTDQPLQDPQWWCEVPFPGAQAEPDA